VCYITSSFYSIFSIAVQTLNNRSVNDNYTLYGRRKVTYVLCKSNDMH